MYQTSIKSPVSTVLLQTDKLPMEIPGEKNIPPGNDSSILMSAEYYNYYIDREWSIKK